MSNIVIPPLIYSSVIKKRTPSTEQTSPLVGYLLLPRAFPRMSGINLIGDRAMRIMDLLRVRQLISASPVTIPFKAPSFFIRLCYVLYCFCIEMNVAI